MRGGWRAWTGLWLLMATAITACAPALPTRTDPSPSKPRSPCVAPLVIDATPDLACTVTANPGPSVETGARLAVGFDGALACALFPYACSVTLSVLPVGTDVPDEWRPPTTDPWWGADWPSNQSVDPQAIGNVPTLPPGSHRLVASVLGSYDTPSYAPDGSVARDLLARCWLDVDIESAIAQVAVRISLEPDGTSFGGTCSIDLVP